jgi:hypothetical protein
MDVASGKGDKWRTKMKMKAKAIVKCKAVKGQIRSDLIHQALEILLELKRLSAFIVSMALS